MQEEGHALYLYVYENKPVSWQATRARCTRARHPGANCAGLNQECEGPASLLGFLFGLQ